MTVIAVDTETTGLSVWAGDKPFMVCIYAPELGYIHKTGIVDPFTRTVKWDSDDLYVLSRALCDPTIEKVFHNAKFDIRMLDSIGLQVRGKIHDTYYMAKACFTNEPKYGLKPLAKKYLDIDDSDEKELKKAVQSARLKAKKLGYRLAESLEADYWLCPDLALKYCKGDVNRCYLLMQFYLEGMEALKVRAAYDKEMELFPHVYDMEERGLRVDYEKMGGLVTEARQKYQEIDVDLALNHQVANINSHPEIRLLLKKNGLVNGKLTPSGLASTSSEALQHIDHPLVDKVISYRGYKKAEEYLFNYVEHSHPDTIISVPDLHTKQYAIHCSLDQWGAGTNRFSCRGPNLQNVADPSTSGKRVPINLRSVFVPRRDYLWVTYDYKQLEMRIFASRAGETALLAAFRNNRDIHDETRLIVLPTLSPGVGRKIAKNINFLKIYGGGYKTMSEKYGVPLEEAKYFLSEYDNKFPGIEKELDKNIRLAKTNGYIVNAFGRKIFVNSDFAYRATNYDIQSSAADLMKTAIIKVGNFLKEIGKRYYMLLTIHDELIIEIHKADFDLQILKVIKELFEDNEGKFSIDTPSDCKLITDNWGEKMELVI